MQALDMTLYLTQVGSSIRGSYESATGGRGSITGTVAGNRVTFAVALSVPAAGQALGFNGVVNGEMTSMSGAYHYEGDTATGSWDAMNP